MVIETIVYFIHLLGILTYLGEPENHLTATVPVRYIPKSALQASRSDLVGIVLLSMINLFSVKSMIFLLSMFSMRT